MTVPPITPIQILKGAEKVNSVLSQAVLPASPANFIAALQPPSTRLGI
jgi:hypothetical protein